LGEVASLFAEPLDVGFGLLARWVNILTDLSDALVLARWLYVHDKTLVIGCANDPPIRERRIGKGEKERAYQHRPAQTKASVHPKQSLLLAHLSRMAAENRQRMTIS
jgi:hypothetical protein